MGRRIVKHVDSQVETELSNCRFLKQKQQQEQEHHVNDGNDDDDKVDEASTTTTFPSSTSSIATFHRSDIEIGDFLGRGAFSEVYNVTSFVISYNDTDDQSSLRQQHLQQTAIDEVTGKSRYVIKHLRNDLITKSSNTNNSAKFYSAAADLVLEVR